MCTNLSRLLRYVNMRQKPVFTPFASLVNEAQTRNLIHVQVTKEKLTWHFLHICYPCNFPLKGVFYKFCFPCKCVTNTSFDLHADMAKVKQT